MLIGRGELARKQQVSSTQLFGYDPRAHQGYESGSARAEPLCTPGFGLSVQNIECVIDIGRGVEQVRGQAQVTFPVGGIYPGVSELLVAVVAAAVSAAQYDQRGPRRSAGRADQLVLAGVQPGEKAVD